MSSLSNDVKKLYRSVDNRVIGGVCGGIAEYFNIDPLIVRIIFVVLLLAKGGGGLLYILLWIFIPSADAKKSTSKR